MSERRPFQPLFARLAGESIDETLHEGVPPWLRDPLETWLHDAIALTHPTDRAWVMQAVVSLRWEVAPGRDYSETLVYSRGDRLLEATDAVLYHHPDWNLDYFGDADELRATVAFLVDLLHNAGSAYTVDLENRRLIKRVNDTVRAAATTAMKSAPADAADHLRRAWAAAYGLHPDPDKAYSEAVKAVEAVAAPLITPNTNRRTLGKAIADLRSQRTHWESTIGDPASQPTNVDRWTGMLELLWQGQSRHAGSSNSRRQTQQEAEAAVHLAVLLVQLLTTDALRKP